VTDTNKSGTIFIREDTPLPENVSIESEAFLPGWRVVRNLDRSTLARNIESTKWFFFYLAGAMRATVLGRDRPGTLRRAVKRVLAKQEGRKFNSLEITKVVLKRFLGIPFMSVTAHSRHIQQGIALVPAKDFVLRMPAAPNGEVVARQYTALVSSS
jgi:predicted amino acid-binding ACT domain protein